MKSLAELQKRACDAREAAHAPYSNFFVGAALETTEGQIFTGCNVENLSYGLTLCAERTAVVSAVAAGARAFRRIVIVADSREPITPCGACRQVLAEFAEDLEVISVNLQGKKYRTKLSTLLPRAKAGILDKPCST
jgi:cytidine deaminase